MNTITPEVGMGATIYTYSDSHPYTITKIINEKTICVKGCWAAIDPTWKADFHPGGFCGHTADNDSQRWIIDPVPSEDTKETVYTLRKNGRWIAKGQPMRGGDELVVGKRIKFHDFNF